MCGRQLKISKGAGKADKSSRSKMHYFSSWPVVNFKVMLEFITVF